MYPELCLERTVNPKKTSIILSSTIQASDECYDSSDFYDSDNDFYYYSSGGKNTTADGNNDNKETGNDSGESGLSLEKLPLKPRKKLLVLGLNGLLLYRVYRFNKAGFPTTRNPDGRYACHLGMFDVQFAIAISASISITTLK